jgi:plastocyanin
MSHKPLAALAALTIILAACGGAMTTPTWTDLPLRSPGADDTQAPASSAAPSGDTPGPIGGTPAPSATFAPSGSAGETVPLTIGTDTGSALLFDPTSVTAPAGATLAVTFENRSLVPHNLTFEAPISEGTATVVDAGASETIDFTAPDPGTYAYVCTLHPGMEGTLRVE